jgi:hypothetical protein
MCDNLPRASPRSLGHIAQKVTKGIRYGKSYTHFAARKSPKHNDSRLGEWCTYANGQA